jgi:hypothetical protein
MFVGPEIFVRPGLIVSIDSDSIHSTQFDSIIVLYAIGQIGHSLIPMG